MTVEKIGSDGVLTPDEVGRLDSRGEKGHVDLLAEHILAGRIRRDTLFSNLVPITPLEVERESI